jgi:acetyl-CoA synthetase (ADP-forming)
MTMTLSEYESKALLRDAGIPVPQEWLASDPEEAVGAAEQCGYPVVLKLCGRGIAHKTERNLVRLGLTDKDQVRRESEDLLSLRSSEESDARVLVQPIVSGRRELIAGLVRDAQFGPCVMLGLGGVFAEALRDVAFAVAPLEKNDAEDLIGALNCQQVLGEFRGEPPADRARLASILDALGRIGMERSDIRSIDINPIILQGSEPVVVDALVEVEESG